MALFPQPHNHFFILPWIMKLIFSLILNVEAPCLTLTQDVNTATR
jgi:hypothetical protein